MRTPRQLQPTASSSFNDPFQQVANQPWQQMNFEADDAADIALPLPETATETALSYENEDDAVITSADPAACDFLLAAIMFQEQQSIKQQQSGQQRILQTVLVTSAGSSIQNSSRCAGSQDSITSVEAAPDRP